MCLHLICDFLSNLSNFSYLQGGLALRVEEADLRAHLEPFGTVTDVMVVRDNDTDLSRG